MTTGSKLIEMQNQATNEAGNQAEKPTNQVWLNVGIRLQDGTLISTPVGIAVDSLMEKFEKLPPAKTPKMQQIRAYQKELIQGLLDSSNQLAPGATLNLDVFPNGMNFAAELRHIDEKKEVVAPTSLGLFVKKPAT